VVVL
jgi:hypothetical protein